MAERNSPSEGNTNIRIYLIIGIVILFIISLFGVGKTFAVPLETTVLKFWNTNKREHSTG
jgi:hypothetical protein